MNEAQCPSAFLKLADKPCLVVSHGTLAVFLQFLCFYLIIILQVVQLFETPGILFVSPNHRDFADGPNPAEQYMLKHTHTRRRTAIQNDVVHSKAPILPLHFTRQNMSERRNHMTRFSSSIISDKTRYSLVTIACKAPN